MVRIRNIALPATWDEALLRKKRRRVPWASRWGNSTDVSQCANPSMPARKGTSIMS